MKSLLVIAALGGTNVLGAMHAIASMKLPMRVTAVLPAAALLTPLPR